MTNADLPGLPLPLSGETRLYTIIGDTIDQVGSPPVAAPFSAESACSKGSGCHLRVLRSLRDRRREGTIR
jgi:hypothetical protein